MRQTPELDRAQNKMQPGELTLYGFLGNDQRKLADIINDDMRAVRHAGVSLQQIAERMEALTEAARDIAERKITVEGRYTITVRDDRGIMPSPFGDGHFEKGETTVLDPVSGKNFRWTELAIHMIQAHGFFCGHGSDYRNDPADLIEFLNIIPAPDKDVHYPEY